MTTYRKPSGPADPWTEALTCLTILVALVADVIVLGLQRLVTPWTRSRRTS